MKVLVTAFKPFNKETNNLSIEVLNYIENVDKIILNVCYDDCYKELISNFNLDNYNLIIALGEARSRNEIMLEKRAINLSSCSLPDNSNIVYQNKTIIENGEKYLETSINLDKIKDIITISMDAGKFVCNNLYYHLLSYYPHKSLFIHIPKCINEEQDYMKYAKLITQIINKVSL